MQIKRQHLTDATQSNIITEQQATDLWQFFNTQLQDVPSFRFTHILYYVGGLIAIGSMTLFMNLGWERFGGWGLFSIAISYAMVALVLLHYFYGRLRLPIPAGIMAALVVALTPLAIYGLQNALGFWPHDELTDMAYRDYHRWIDWRWMLMELATLVVGVVMLWRYRLPFSVMPIAVTLWYMSMDLAPFLFGGAFGEVSWALREQVSMWFGLAMLILAVYVDFRGREAFIRGKDFAFWLYLFGVLAFWGGLSSMDSDSEFNKFIYLCINLFMIVIGATLMRRVFVIFGAFGVAGYIAHLADYVFKDSMMFPLILTLLGLLIIWLGVKWQRNEAVLSARFQGFLPSSIREMLSKRV